MTATRLGFREQWRRPLLLTLLVFVPAYAVTRSIAITEPTPRRIGLPGDLSILTNMKELHGAVMAGNAVAFVAGLCGVFVMVSALQADRRLVIAGFRPSETIMARLAVLAGATLLVTGVALIVTAANFDARSWPVLAIGVLEIGLIYAALGAIVGAFLDKLAATYVMLFLSLTDLGIVQNPMFGDGARDGWAAVLPGYGPSRVMVDGGFSSEFHASLDLALGTAWVIALALAVAVVLRRATASRL